MPYVVSLFLLLIGALSALAAYRSQTQWKVMLLIAIAVVAVGGAVFALPGDAIFDAGE